MKEYTSMFFGIPLFIAEEWMQRVFPLNTSIIFIGRAVEHPPQPYIDTHATTTKEYSFVWVAKFRKMNFRYTSLLLKRNFS
jgi:hypothetical protein